MDVISLLKFCWAILLKDFPGGSDGKASLYNAGDPGHPWVGKIPLEKEMAIHSRTIAWKIPWTEETGKLQSMGLQRVGHNWATSLHILLKRASLVAQTVKHLPAMQETQVQSLGWEDPLEKEMAPHSSTLAWKIPWMEEPGWLQSLG